MLLALLLFFFGTILINSYRFAAPAGPAAPTILWWKMLDGSGTSITATAGPTGTTNASWTTSTQSASGFALEFNGTDDTASASMTYGADVITITFWTYYSSGDHARFLESSINPDENDHSFRINRNGDDGNFYASLYGTGGSELPSTSRCSLSDTWHFISIVLDNSTGSGAVKIYVDGSEQSTSVAVNTKSGTGDISAQPLYVGVGSNSTFGFLGGRMDDIRIYDGELSSGDIATLYAAGSQ